MVAISLSKISRSLENRRIRVRAGLRRGHRSADKQGVMVSRLRRFSWRRTVCAIAAASAVCLAACEQSSPPAAQLRTLRIATQKSVEARPVLTDMLYADPLVAIDWHGRPSLRIASGYQWQDNGRTLELTLRRNVLFHDGTPVTAAAVAAVLTKKERTGGFQFVTSIDTPSDGVVLIHVSRPDAFVLDALSGAGIVRVDNPDIGTGAFKLVTREPVIRGERNDSYYRGTPGIEQVQLTEYDTLRGAWAAMMRREVDMVTDVNRDSVEFLRGVTRVEMYSFFRPFYIPLVFNLRHPILRNVEVRRALADAIDRDEVVQRAMRGQGQPADDPLWPFNWAYSPAAHHHSFNPADAASRLEAAGYPVRPAAHGSIMPSRFRIRCLYWNTDPQYERIALMLQRQLAAVGVDLVLEPVEQKQLGRRIKNGEFETYIYQLASGKSFDATYRFWHSDANGVGAMANSGYTGVNEILDRLRATYSDAETRAAVDSQTRVMVSDLRQRFYEDTPAAFIAWVKTTRAVDTRFDVGDRSDPDMLANLWRWHVATPQQRAER
jgi:peptide/nickel transport system substrate-binding protein